MNHFGVYCSECSGTEIGYHGFLGIVSVLFSKAVKR